MAVVPYLLWAFCKNHSLEECERIFRVRCLFSPELPNLMDLAVDTRGIGHVESGHRRGYPAHQDIRVLQQEQLRSRVLSFRPCGRSSIPTLRGYLSDAP